LLGIALLTALLFQIGLKNVADQLGRLKWSFLLIFSISIPIHLFNTLGLSFCLPLKIRPGFMRLFWIRLAGEAINAPTAYVGGEPAKAYLLKSSMPLADAISAVVLAKTLNVVSEAIFLMVGVLLACFFFPIPFVIKATSLFIVCGFVGMSLWFITIQRRGFMDPLFQFLDRRGFKISFLEKRREKILEVDHRWLQFYTVYKKDFILSLSCHLLAWMFVAMETFLIVSILIGNVANFKEVYVIETFTLIIQGLVFFVPAGMGVAEGGYVAIFSLLGMGEGLGLTLGIIKRLRKMVWIALGIAVMPFWNSKSSKKKDSVQNVT
jgi:uncharacterized protein (TIRG00374 family)